MRAKAELAKHLDVARRAQPPKPCRRRRHLACRADVPLRAAGTVRVGVAFYDAFNAREPLQLEYFDLTQKAGTCTSFRTSRQAVTILAQAAHMNPPPDPSPLALSAQVFPSKGLEGSRPLSVFNDLSPAYQGPEIV